MENNSIPSLDTLDGVVFDLGGVIVDLDLNRCIAAFERLGMPRIAALVNPYHPAQMIGELEHGLITFHQACEQMRRLEPQAEVSDEQISQAYGEFLTGIPRAKLRLIDALRQRGLRTYVLSNNNPESMRYIRAMFTADGHTIDHYFDHLYLSYQMGLLKPSPAIFRAMIDHAGMNPARTLYIDDSPANAQAARELGFHTLQPTSNEDFTHLFA